MPWVLTRWMSVILNIRRDTFINASNVKGANCAMLYHSFTLICIPLVQLIFTRDLKLHFVILIECFAPHVKAALISVRKIAQFLFNNCKQIKESIWNRTSRKVTRKKRTEHYLHEIERDKFKWNQGTLVQLYQMDCISTCDDMNW